MGRRYSFELFYPASHVEAGFHAMDRYLPTFFRKRTGEPRKSSHSPPALDLRSLTPDSPIFFRTSLLFPVDEHVRAFRSDWEDRDIEWDDDGNEYLPVGEIDVAIRLGQEFAVFTYAAVTSRMSDLFERSRAIWKQFDVILRTSGGLVAIFHGCVSRGPAAYPVLPGGTASITFDFFDFVTEERDTYWQIDVDRYASAVLRAVQKET